MRFVFSLEIILLRIIKSCVKLKFRFSRFKKCLFPLNGAAKLNQFADQSFETLKKEQNKRNRVHKNE